MKIQTYILSLCFGLIMSPNIGFAQNTTIDSLRKILKTEKEDTNEVNTLNELGLNFIYNNDSVNAMQFTKNALTLAQKINFKKGEGTAYNLIASVYQAGNKFPEAIDNFFIASKIQDEVGDKQGSADSYEQI